MDKMKCAKLKLLPVIVTVSRTGVDSLTRRNTRRDDRQRDKWCSFQPENVRRNPGRFAVPAQVFVSTLLLLITPRRQTTFQKQTHQHR